MNSAQILVVCGALSGALFPLGVLAQEHIERGNQRNPHQPPAWVLRFVTPEPLVPDELRVHIPEAKTVIGRPHPVRPKYGCRITDENGQKKWSFCEL